MEKITTGQATELIALFAKKLSLSMPKSVAQGWINNPSRFEDVISEALMPVPCSLDELLRSWVEFYKKHFGIDVDVSNLQVPAGIEGFDRLILIVKGIGLNRIYEACSGQFKCHKHTDSDLEIVVTRDDRASANGTYAIWVRDVVEADVEMETISAGGLVEKSIKGVTLLERLVYELKYFSETGKHLDVRNWTLCSGSRLSGGNVPCARWIDGQLSVRSVPLDYWASDLRSRVVVG